jgi:hypothetical protein
VNAGYTCYRTRTAPDWDAAPRSPRFVDMVSGEPGFFDTRAAALWDDHALHIRFWIEEPFIEAHLTERDSLIFNESDVEVFLDGGDCYYEFEVNARNTVYEVFFIWQDAFERFQQEPEFDVLKRNAVTFGGDYDRAPATFWRGAHPRGLRWAFLDWDFPGLTSSTAIDGYLNDRTRISRGWQATVSLPWAGMKHLANGRALPPRDGDEWRIFFGRFEKLMSAGREVQPHPAWCWTQHGIYDTHRPECWTRVRFSQTCLEDLPR